MADPRFEVAKALLNESISPKIKASKRYAAAAALLDRAFASGKGIRFNAGTPSKAHTLIRDINKYRESMRDSNDGMDTEYDAFIVRRVKVCDQSGEMVFGSIVEIELRPIPSDDEIIDL